MPVPKAGEVLVQVLAAAINPSDAKNVLGKMPETKTPRVPGRDFAGRVVSGDSRWEGKAVFGTGGDLGFGRDGSHAEFVAVPVEGLVEMPPDLSYEQATAIALGYFTAFAGCPNGCGKARRNRPGHRDHGVRRVGGGQSAKGLTVGQRVGLGWFADSCLTCEWCKSGNHHLCASGRGPLSAAMGALPTGPGQRRLGHTPA